MSDTKKLKALAAVAAEVDALAPEAVAEAKAVEVAEVAAQSEAEQQAQAWAVVPYSIGAALGMWLPVLKNVYTPDACNAWGVAMVPVAQKHGWGGPSAMPEINLAILTAGLAIPTGLAIKMQLDAMRESNKNGKEGGEEGAPTITQVPHSQQLAALDGAQGGGP